MKKNGFTLVELLAVIAILAILMLLIMPNVLNMFNSGKKDAFKVQVNSIKKAAEEKIQSDTMEGINITRYCDKISSNCTSKYRLSNDAADTSYILTFINNQISSIGVSNSNYCYYNNTDVNSINEEDFVENATLVCDGNNCSCGKYVYWTTDQGGENSGYGKNKIPTITYDSVEELGFTTAGKYVRSRVAGDGTVMGHEVCLYYENKSFCLDDTYFDTDSETTKLKMKTAFKELYPNKTITCNSYTDSDGNKSAYCYVDGYNCGSYSHGFTLCQVSGKYCSTHTHKSASCK